jgi:hypothetical protein
VQTYLLNENAVELKLDPEKLTNVLARKKIDDKYFKEMSITNELRVTQPMLTQWKNGSSTPPEFRIRELAGALDVAVEDLCFPSAVVVSQRAFALTISAIHEADSSNQAKPLSVRIWTKLVELGIAHVGLTDAETVVSKMFEYSAPKDVTKCLEAISEALAQSFPLTSKENIAATYLFLLTSAKLISPTDAHVSSFPGTRGDIGLIELHNLREDMLTAFVVAGCYGGLQQFAPLGSTSSGSVMKVGRPKSIPAKSKQAISLSSDEIDGDELQATFLRRMKFELNPANAQAHKEIYAPLLNDDDLDPLKRDREFMKGQLRKLGAILPDRPENYLRYFLLLDATLPGSRAEKSALVTLAKEFNVAAVYRRKSDSRQGILNIEPEVFEARARDFFELIFPNKQTVYTLNQKEAMSNSPLPPTSVNPTIHVSGPAYIQNGNNAHMQNVFYNAQTQQIVQGLPQQLSEAIKAFEIEVAASSLPLSKKNVLLEDMAQLVTHVPQLGSKTAITPEKKTLLAACIDGIKKSASVFEPVGKVGDAVGKIAEAAGKVADAIQPLL